MTKKLIDLLLLERIYLRGIARVTKVSWSWLQNYVNNKFSQVLRQVKVTKKSKGKLIRECAVREAMPKADIVICIL